MGSHRVGHDWSDLACMQCPIMCVYCISHGFFIHSSVDGHVGCFRILAIGNNAAMNRMVQLAFQGIVFIFFR